MEPDAVLVALDRIAAPLLSGIAACLLVQPVRPKPTEE
jgi:hypothetical protein